MNKNLFAPLPPMGWNSYDYYDTTVNEAQVRANAEYMAEHLKCFGWEYIVVDIEWYAHKAGSQRDKYQYIPFSKLEMDEYGRLLPDPERFPSSKDGQGFKPLASYIHSLGLKFGIHIMRGIPRIAAHLHSKVLGCDVTANEIADPSSICKWNPDMYGVRNLPEGQAYYDSLLSLYASWGVDFIKCDDICNTNLYVENQYSARHEVEMLAKAIERRGREIVLSLSPGPALIEQAWHYETYANMWRITDDFWDHWDALKDMFHRCELWQRHVSKGCYPDCDMLPLGYLGKGFGEERQTFFTKEEQKTMLSLWSLFGSPLMLGAELTKLDEWTMSLLSNSEILKMRDPKYRPEQQKRNEEQAVWTAFDEESGTGYIALFNLSEKELSVEADLSRWLPKQGAINLSEELWTGEKVDFCEDGILRKKAFTSRLCDISDKMRVNVKGMVVMVGKKWKYAVAFLTMISLLLAGCGQSFEKQQEKCPYEEFIVVDVFDSLANYQGIQSGWFAKLVKDKFNMELNIIAPNVAGGGDTLFEVRSAAGNLGDLIICSGDNGTPQNLITAGLIQDMEPYIKNQEIMRFKTAIRGMNQNYADTGIYAIPTELSENDPLKPSEILEPTYGPYLRWDLYKQLGYPKMETLEDMLPVLKQMQELCPVTETGEKTYGISFFRDWDANLMNAVKQPCCFYGYDEYGFLLVSADGKEFQSILDMDSMYMRVLKWYFDANQMGLIDPESATQNYESFTEKYKNGQIFYSPWPWASQTYFNTSKNAEQGKGYMMADIADMEIYSYGCSPDGNHKSVVAIGSQAEDPQRIADFINWLYSSEGIRAMGVGNMSGTAGPEGLCWEYGEDGPELTEFGKKALMQEGVEVPEEWGSGNWEDGICELNFMPVTRCELDEKGYPYQYQAWDSVRKMEETVLEKDWKAQMGADTTLDYLIENDKLAVSPGCGYSTPPETPEQAEIRRQCRAVILKYSGEMIFAQNEEEFYRLRDEMQKEAMSMGYETILALDLENAREKEMLRWKSVEKYQKENR